MSERILRSRPIMYLSAIAALCSVGNAAYTVYSHYHARPVSIEMRCLNCPPQYQPRVVNRPELDPKTNKISLEYELTKNLLAKK